MFKKKYIAVFLIREQGSYNINSMRRIKPLTKTIKGIPIDTSIQTYSKGLKLYFCIDLTSKKQITFDKDNKPNINTKVIDDILAQKIISELTRDMSGSNFKNRLYDIITGGLIGGLTGFIVAGFVFGGFV